MSRCRKALCALTLAGSTFAASGLSIPVAAKAPSLRDGPAAISYCGFSAGPADSIAQMGGGGDTIVLSGPWDMYYFVSDDKSPVTLDSHDTLIFTQLQPDELRLWRNGNDLVICHDARAVELVIQGQYCRALKPSSAQVSNYEIEALVFSRAGVIWLSDTLYPLWQKEPHRFPTANAYNTGRDASAWQIVPFSKRLPDIRPVPGHC